MHHTGGARAHLCSGRYARSCRRYSVRAPRAYHKIENRTEAKRDLYTLYLSIFASAHKLQMLRAPVIQAKPFFAHTLSIALALTLLSARVASAEPQSQRTARLQSRTYSTARGGPSAPWLLWPARSTCSSSDSAPCVNPLPFLELGAQFSADAHTNRTNSGDINITPKLPVPEHRFWDRKNDLLFAAVGASRALDYSSTLNFRRRGRQEAFLTNDIVDNHAAFAAIEAAGTAVSIGVSYLFHRYHHHRLEHWTSIVHASLSASGAVRNYCLKTEVPSSAP